MPRAPKCNTGRQEARKRIQASRSMQLARGEKSLADLGLITKEEVEASKPKELVPCGVRLRAFEEGGTFSMSRLRTLFPLRRKCGQGKPRRSLRPRPNV